MKFFAKNRTERVKALAESLTANGYDVVCLQELWCDDNYNYLKQSCQNIFKYIHYFHRYVSVLHFNINIIIILGINITLNINYSFQLNFNGKFTNILLLDFNNV